MMHGNLLGVAVCGHKKARNGNSISEMTCDDVLSFIKNELCADKLAISVVKGAAE